MIAYIGGILTVALLPSLTYIGIFALLIPLLGIRSLRRGMLFYLLGVALAASWGGWQLYHRLPSSPEPVDMKVHGRIDSLVQHQEDRQTFTLKVLALDSERSEHQRLRRLRVSFYHAGERLGYGDELEALIRLRSPRGLYNPAGLDTERFYLSSGLDARGYIRQLIRHRPAENLSIGMLRRQLRDWLDRRFAPQAAVTLRALIIGDRTGLSELQQQWLRRTGTAHLLVVSGLHVAVVATLGWLLGRALSMPLLLAGLSRLGYILPLSGALVTATAYAALAGWGLPVQRAWLMLLIFLIGNWQLLNLSGWQRLKLALLVILSWQPLAVLEPGLWLSFAAVALILWQLQQRQHPLPEPAWRRLPGQWWRVQLALFLGLSPVLIINFNQLSLAGIGINLIAVPWVSLSIWLLPLMLLLTGFWPDCGSLLQWNLDQIWHLLGWGAEVPGLVLQVGSPHFLVLMLSLAGLLVLLLPLPLRMRAPALLLYLPLLLAPSSTPQSGQFRAWVFDVGQGQAILIETAEDLLLYDTGPGFGAGRSAFPYTVAPYLRRLGNPALDRVVISHGDLDHSGGLGALRRDYDIGRLLSGEPLPGVPAESCRHGNWESAGVQFGLLDPFGNSVEALSSNDRSCVLRVSNGRCSLLLTGDLSQSGEYRLLSAGKIEPVTWLVAGHHGSRDSTTGALLDYATPEQVLISVGFGNRFGHPHEEVIERIERRNIPWSSTARQGALLLQASGDSCTLTRYRELKKRYWTAS